MEPTFPLLRLPENAIIKVFRNICLDELFFISLVSSKTKNLVKLLRLEACVVKIKIDRSIEIVVYTQPPHLYLTLRPFTLLEFSEWMNHIRTVFCYTPPPSVRFDQGCEKYKMELLKDAIGNVNNLFLSRQLTDVNSRKVLKYFNTPNKFVLRRNPFEESQEIQRFFIQNLQFMEYHDVYSLDDMLLVNSERISLYHPTTQKQFNRFLKHWIRGSNPRLQYMSLSINNTGVVSGKIYLKGIRCMEMSEETKGGIHRKHKLSVNIDMIQIRRKDGTPAVIGTNKSENVLYVHFIVLH
ncbi:hypothetical protein CRE_23063 [Caenorhabditis remanei]|uniref:F-box domain-containing protein n=1 Tax=Caenorhabditis remanei TaxID=31234 RepID=E3N9G5_CAERE|nr:hypothetical protein CRE_23063 [Caenorhabditis remanei]